MPGAWWWLTVWLAAAGLFYVAGVAFKSSSGETPSGSWVLLWSAVCLAWPWTMGLTVVGFVLGVTARRRG